MCFLMKWESSNNIYRGYLGQPCAFLSHSVYSNHGAGPPYPTSVNVCQSLSSG